MNRFPPFFEPESTKILFEIEPYNYLEPLLRLKDNKYYQNIIKSLNQNEYKLYQKNKVTLPQSDINDILMIEYIKCFSNNNIIVLYPKALSKSDKIKKTFFDTLDKNGNVYYSKTLKISYYHAYNLLFSLYGTTNRMKKNNQIIYKLNRLGFINDGNEYDILIVVYQHLNKEQSINGSTSPFKSMLRNIFLNDDLDTVQIDPLFDMYPREYDYLHVNDSFHECIQYCLLFLHKNTFDFISNQQSWRLMKLYNGQYMFNNFCKILFRLPLSERNKIMLMSSTVLFSYGIRNMNDIDGIVDSTIEITKSIIDSFNTNKIDIYYGDITNILEIDSKQTKNEIWVEELNKRAKLFGASNYNDLLEDPKYHYYFMGVKMLNLEYEIMVRNIRRRPAQLVDLLIINRLLFMNYNSKKKNAKALKIELPLETSVFDENTKKDIVTPINKNKYLQTCIHYLQKRYELYLTIDQVNLWISSSENIQIYNEIPNHISLKTEIKFEAISILQNLDLKDLYSLGKNISSDKIIYPSVKELLEKKYISCDSILADNKPYTYKGEDWIDNQFLCNRQPKHVNPKDDTKLRVLSFNVHNFISRCNQGIQPIFFNNLNMFENGRKINEFLNLFKNINADIICLQEFVPIKEEIINDINDYDEIRKINFEYINNEMKKLGYIYSCIGDANQGKFSINEPRSYYMLCNAIYSKLPILEEKIFQLFINRNIISVKVNYNNKDIWILNTHSAYFNEDTSESISLKKDMVVLQFETIKYIVENEFLNNSYKNLIFCGDFNINLFEKKNNYRYKNYDSIKNLMLAHFNNSFRTSLTTNFSQNDQTDFILISKVSSIRPTHSLVYYSTISDHFPIFTDFQ
jgi:endonuclease/exonuclease/phosphatase family metal-dependent hydrolase